MEVSCPNFKMCSTFILTILVLAVISVGHATYADITTDFLPNTQICGLQSTNDHGTEDVAGLGEFPWSALIGYQIGNKFQYLCDGTLINDKFVITSAYCVNNVSDDFVLFVRLGEHTINNETNCTSEDSTTKCSEKSKIIESYEIIIHDDYTENNSRLNDIALIKLEEAVKFSDYISPICVPTTSKLLSNKYEGSVMTLAGWESFDNDLATNVKRKIKAIGKSTEECNSKFSSSVHKVTINDSQLCALSTNELCRVYVGSALAIQDAGNWYITGIASFDVTACPSDVPIIYTRASSFAQWIVEILEEEEYEYEYEYEEDSFYSEEEEEVEEEEKQKEGEKEEDKEKMKKTATKKK